MKNTHRARIHRQAVQLWTRNFIPLLLSFGLAGTLSVVANSPACAHLPLGAFGEVLSTLVLRTKTILFVGYAGVFYLVVGVLFYFTGQKLKFREIQRRVFQPFLAPTLFVVAGYMLGLPAARMGESVYWWSVGGAVGILLLSTMIANIYELVEGS